VDLIRRRKLVVLLLFIATGFSARAEDNGPDAWDGWRLELQWIGQPDQPQDHDCSRRVDCLSNTRSIHAGALSASYAETDTWSATLKLGLGRAYDWERRPASGFGVLSLRADVVIELGRTRDVFGLALRASPSVLYGWAGRGGELVIGFPGVAVLFGWRDLWGEIAVPAQPSHADPRLFYIQGAWRDDHFMAAAAIGTFGSLAFAGTHLQKAGSFIGVWLEGRARLWESLEVHVTMAISTPTILSLGLVWAPATDRTPALLD